MKYKIPLSTNDFEIEDAEDISEDEAKEVVVFIAKQCVHLISEICEFAEENGYDPNDLLDCSIDTLDLFGSQVDLSYYEVDEDGEGFFEIPDGYGMLS